MKLASRRITTWIAIFAVLLAALAPSVSQALASSPQQSTTWTEICTSTGMQFRQDIAPITGSGEREGIMSKHCPFCLNHACHFVLPTTPLEFSLTIGASVAFFRPAATLPSPRFACTSPQSRAPPVIS
jgi:hypothetical protein